MLGLHLGKTPAATVDLLYAYGKNLSTVNSWTAVIGLSALAIIICANKWKIKFTKFVPASLIAIVVSSLLVELLSLDSVATIGSVYPELNVNVFVPTIPKQISFSIIQQLIEPAFSIAILAGIESLLSAVIADGMIGSKHRSNAELFAHGIANICSASFGGLPVTAAIARTATNIKNGAKTPIAGMVHAITVLAIMLVFMPLAKKIPLACLAAILTVIAFNMGDWQVFRDIKQTPKSDSIVFLATCTLAILFDLTIAIKVGLVLAAFLFIKRMGDVTEINRLLEVDESDELADLAARLNIQKQLGDHALLYEIRGPFFFGAVDKLADTINKINNNTKLIIIKMHEVPVIDTTGYHSLHTLLKTCQHNNITIYFTHLRTKPYKMLIKSGFVKLVGDKYFCKSIAAAVNDYKEHNHRAD